LGRNHEGKTSEFKHSESQTAIMSRAKQAISYTKQQTMHTRAHTQKSNKKQCRTEAAHSNKTAWRLRSNREFQRYSLRLDLVGIPWGSQINSGTGGGEIWVTMGGT
jgi:hypothetical protein